MIAPRRFFLLFAISAGVVALFIIYVTWVGPWLSLKCLEYQVKKNIDPMELQQWATNLLAQHPGYGTNYQDFHGTNMPPGLKKVKGYGHDVEIFSSEGRRWVSVFCGSKGGPFLVVESSTAVNTNLLSWKPGIYFVGPR